MKVIDLSKVIYAEFYYTNGITQRTKLPLRPTVRGEEVADGYALPHHDYPNETLLERAKRLDILDKWEARIELKTYCRELVTYYGQKAISINKAWNAKQFRNKEKAPK